MPKPKKPLNASLKARPSARQLLELRTRLAEAEKELQALREDHQRFRLLFDKNPDGVFTVDPAGRLTQVNPACEKISGYSRTELLGKSFLELCAPDQAAKTAAQFLRSLHASAYAELETALLRKDGSRVELWIAGEALLIEGRVVALHCTARDITERKRTEAELRQAREDYRLLVEYQTDLVARLSRDGRRLYVNPSFLKLVGKTEAEVLNSDYAPEIHPEDAPRVAEQWKETFEPPLYRSEIEARTRDAQGQWRWCSWRNVAIRNEQGEPSTAICVGREVTELKQTEQALQQAHRQLQTTIDSITDGLLVMDQNWRYTFFSEQAARIVRVRREDMLGKVVWDLFPRAKGTKFYEFYHRAVETRQPQHFEEFYPEPLNQWLECHCYPSAEGLTVYFHDVTERKLAELALRQSEARLRTLFEAGLLGVIFWNMDGQILDANEKFLRMVGYTRQELLSGAVNWDQMTPPEFRHLDEFAVHELKTTGVDTPYEKEYLRKDGSRLPILIGAAMFDDQRHEGVAFVLDITARKRTEARLRRFYETDLFAVLYWQIDGGVIDVNDQFLKMTGYSREDLRAGLINWSQITPPEFHDQDEDARRQIRETGVHRPYEKQYIRKDGTRVWGLFSAAAYEDDRTHGVSFILDITQRKLAEAALRESRDQFRIMGESIDCGVWMCNQDGGAEYVSQSFLDLLNMTMEQMKQFGWTSRLVPEDVPGMLQRWLHCVRTGQPWDGEHRIIDRHGQIHTILTRGNPVRDPHGRITSWVGINLDITERKRAEAEREKLLEQIEHQRLFLEAVLEQLPVGVNIDPDGTNRCMTTNRAGMAIFELQPGDNVSATAPEDERPANRYFRAGRELRGDELPMQQAIARNQPVEDEIEVLTARGNRRLLRVNATVVYDKSGKQLGSVGVSWDITEQKRAEEALREKEAYAKAVEAARAERQRFLDMLDTLPVVIDIIRADHRIEWTNRAYRQALGDNQGLPCYQSQFHRDTPCEECQAFTPLKTGQPHHWEWTLPNGRTFDIYNFPFAAADGSPAVLEMDIDITAIRQAQAELQHANQTLERRVEERTQALRDNEERFRALFEYAPEAVFLTIPEGQIVAANRAACAMFGRSQQEICQLGRAALADLADPRQVELAEERRRQGSVVNKVATYLRASGERFEAETSSVLLPGGKAFVIIRDITERLRAEQALRFSEEKFLKAFAANPAAIAVTRLADGQYLDVNDTWVELMGYSRAEAIQTTALALNIWPAIETRDRFVDELLQKGSIRAWEVELHKKSGARCVVQLSSQVLPLQGEKVVLSTLVDITQRKRAEEALRESEAKLRLALDAAQFGTFELRIPTGEVIWDNQMRRIWGLGAQDTLNYEAVTGRVHPEDRERVERIFAEALAPSANGYYTAEYRVVWPDGSVHWAGARGCVHFAGEGPRRHAVRVVGIEQDITRQKEFEAELQRLVADRTAKLQEMVAELEHMSYSIVHDMRAPLRAMYGFAEMLAETCAACPHPDTQHLLQRIQTAATRMDSLIVDALNYNRAVRQELPLETIDLDALLRGMLDTYPEFQAAKAHIQVQGHLPPVLGNQAGLTQCFSNLLNNALKFVKPGQKPTIRIWPEWVDSAKLIVDSPSVVKPSGSQLSTIKHHFAAGHQPSSINHQLIRVFVEDDGIGIPASMLPRVFNMFSRGHTTYPGTGIGLALVRKVMDRMGGRVGVQSKEGKGSLFWLDLQPAP